MVTSPRKLTVRTRKLRSGDARHDQQLLDWLPDRAPLSWVRDGEGLVGWGEIARLDTGGSQRFAEAEQWWQDVVDQVEVDDEVGLPGTGPVAFASLAFADDPGQSVLVLPRVVVGQRDGVRWITTLGEDEPWADPSPVRRPGVVRYSDGHLSTTDYREAVAEAVRRMRGHSGISKIVLAHDRIASTADSLDTRFLLHNLAHRYPNCWTYAVDGLVGATPELLLKRSGTCVGSRVLAGTIWPRDGSPGDELAAELFSSAKNRHEHAYAIDSLADSLKPFCSRLSVPSEPSVLRLRNVMHLASDVSGVLSGNAEHNGAASLLRMVEAVHPTAAVGGTPTDDAVQVISELERMDRGRYAGPVGWIDGAGNGEFGVALRCAQLQGNGTARLFAGCGIVADSDPDMEVVEAEAKLLPIREALEGVD